MVALVRVVGSPLLMLSLGRGGLFLLIGCSNLVEEAVVYWAVSQLLHYHLLHQTQC